MPAEKVNKNQNTYEHEFNLVEEKKALESDRNLITENKINRNLKIKKLSEPIQSFNSWSAHRIYYNFVSSFSFLMSYFVFIGISIVLGLLAIHFTSKNIWKTWESQIFLIVGLVLLFVVLVGLIIFSRIKFQKKLNKFYSNYIFDKNLEPSEKELSKIEILKTKSIYYLKPFKGSTKFYSDLAFLETNISIWGSSKQNRIYFKNFGPLLSYLMTFLTILFFMMIWIPFIVYFPKPNFIGNKTGHAFLNITLTIVLFFTSYILVSSLFCYLAMKLIQKKACKYDK